MDLRLSVGTTVNLRLAKRPNDQRFAVQVLGYLDGESVLVSAPREGAALVPLYVGDAVTLRYLAGRDIIGFATHVRHVADEPFAYVHLSAPEAVEVVTIRDAERAVVRLPAALRPAAGDRGLDAMIVDISASGCRVEAAQPLGDIGSRVAVTFAASFASVTQTLTLSGEIRSARAQPGEPFVAGIRFVDTVDADRLLLQGFVYEHLVAGRADLRS